MTQKPSTFFTEFDAMFNSLTDSKEKVAICTHRMPDPDALGSSRGLQWLLRYRYNIDASIFAGDEISHPQNRTMVNRLQIRIEDDANFQSDDYPVVIAVDTTSKRIKGGKADIVIDHHKVTEDSDALALIQPVGAASTLVWELIDSIINVEEIPWEKDDIHSHMATGLLLGIHTDTRGLYHEATTSRDWHAAQELTKYFDRLKMHDIINYPIPLSFFELEQVLSRPDNHQRSNSIFVGSVGIIRKERRDVIPLLADKLVRLEGIETAVIFGLIDGYLEASVRSQNAATDVPQLCQAIFKKQYAGGKPGAGAARVPLAILDPTRSPADMQNEIEEIVRKKVFHDVLTTLEGN